ncbi:MAG: hypothetical protein IIZ19_04420, partial [Clostridia bacterium]|nr:hypothetical protein [Clostridia bacterium]
IDEVYDYMTDSTVVSGTLQGIINEYAGDAGIENAVKALAADFTVTEFIQPVGTSVQPLTAAQYEAWASKTLSDIEALADAFETAEPTKATRVTKIQSILDEFANELAKGGITVTYAPSSAKVAQIMADKTTTMSVAAGTTITVTYTAAGTESTATSDNSVLADAKNIPIFTKGYNKVLASYGPGLDSLMNAVCDSVFDSDGTVAGAGTYTATLVIDKN